MHDTHGIRGQRKRLAEIVAHDRTRERSTGKETRNVMEGETRPIFNFCVYMW